MSSNDIGRRDVLLGAAGGAGLLLAISARSGAAEPSLTETEAANVRLVTAFCAAWSTRDLKNVTALMTDDAVYRMSQTTPPVVGHDGLVGQMQTWVDSSESIEFKILETLAKGPIVLNHRIDHFVSKTRPVTWEGVGVFYVEDGKIKEWSDYTIRVERS